MRGDGNDWGAKAGACHFRRGRCSGPGRRTRAGRGGRSGAGEPGGSRLRALEEARRLRRELAALALKPAAEELDAIRGERTGEFDRLR